MLYFVNSIITFFLIHNWPICGVQQIKLVYNQWLMPEDVKCWLNVTKKASRVFTTPLPLTPPQPLQANKKPFYNFDVLHQSSCTRSAVIKLCFGLRLHLELLVVNRPTVISQVLFQDWWCHRFWKQLDWGWVRDKGKQLNLPTHISR